MGLLYPASSCAALSSLPWTLLRPPVHEPDVGLVSLEHKKRRVGGGALRAYLLGGLCLLTD